MKKLGIFVDDANMFYAKRKAGVRIDYASLKSQLERHFDVQFVNYHMVMPAKWDTSYTPSVLYKSELPSFISMHEKPMKYIKIKNPDGTYSKKRKGDIDMELAIDVLHNLDNLDAVLVFAGDSDYVALRREVAGRGKKIAFASFSETIAWELRKGPHVLLDEVVNAENKAPSTGLGVLLRSLLYSNEEIMSNETVDKPKS
mgnify:FL=1